MKQRNSPCKKKLQFKTHVIYIILKFKTHHEKRRSVSNVKLAFFSISREVNIVNSVVNLNSPNIFNLLSYAFKTD